MSNSSLVNYTRISPNQYGKRSHAIDRISPHCVVGQLSVETVGGFFADPNFSASSNYCIGSDGRIGMYVTEDCASWCTSSKENDNRAVTIECASDTTHPYTMNTTVYQTLVKLCVDICRRNGKKKLLWLGDKTKTLNYAPKADEMVITIHRWYAPKACPGDWLVQRLGTLAMDVTKMLATSTPNTTPEKPSNGTIYRVQTGAFRLQANAKKLQSELQKRGFDTMIVKVDGLYKVQVGAYSVKANAENMKKKLDALGYPTMIVSSGAVKKATAEEVARSIIRDRDFGGWGTGATREQRLRDAGYDPVEVQRIIDALMR